MYELEIWLADASVNSVKLSKNLNSNFEIKFEKKIGKNIVFSLNICQAKSAEISNSLCNEEGNPGEGGSKNNIYSYFYFMHLSEQAKLDKVGNSFIHIEIVKKVFLSK